MMEGCVEDGMLVYDCQYEVGVVCGEGQVL